MTSAQLNMCAGLVRFIREHEVSNEDTPTPSFDTCQEPQEDHDEPVDD